MDHVHRSIALAVVSCEPPTGADNRIDIRCLGRMPLALVVVVGIVDAYSTAAAIWLLVTGRNLPGILGRGFTPGDNQRLKRAPSIYFRALGALIGMSAVNVTLLGWMMLRFRAAPSIQLAELFAPVIAILVLPTGAALAWVFVLASRHRLIRWDKP